MSEISKKLAAILRGAAQAPHPQKIGIEIERVGMWPDCTPFRYEDTPACSGEVRPGARRLLTQLNQKHGWKFKKTPGGDPIGLTPDEGAGHVSLEPGSQLELATLASDKLNLLVEKTQRFEKQVDTLTEPWGLRWVGVGLNPCSAVSDLDVIPAKRYHIMNEYLPTVGRLATAMMRLTGSVQVNLDYTSEENALEMLRAALAAAPISYALFANSPIKECKPTGYLSYRKKIWDETDPARTGLFHEAFEPNFDFDAYAELATARPLMFAQDQAGLFVPAKGCSLEGAHRGKLPGVSASDFNLRSTLQQQFTEARLKIGYVEVRSIDGLRPRERYAAAAFWMGLLYCADARRHALETLGPLSRAEKEDLMEQTALKGLKAKFKTLQIHSICKDLVNSARCGLKGRGYGEEKYLEPVDEILESGRTPAEDMLAVYHEAKDNKIQAVIDYLVKA